MAVLAAIASKSSTGTVTYETQVHDDGTTTCDCPGWVYCSKARTP